MKCLIHTSLLLMMIMVFNSVSDCAAEQGTLRVPGRRRISGGRNVRAHKNSVV